MQTHEPNEPFPNDERFGELAKSREGLTVLRNRNSAKDWGRRVSPGESTVG